MGRVPHSWQKAYELALKESDPSKFIGRIEYAIMALERRYSEWGSDPGTGAELTAIQKCISVLERKMKQELAGNQGAVPSTAPERSSNATQRSTTKDQEQVTSLSLVVQSSPAQHEVSAPKPPQ